MTSPLRAIDMDLRDALMVQDCDALMKALAAGADPNAQDANGETALHMAVRVVSEFTPHVRLLLEAGANVNLPCKAGITPLMAAVNAGKLTHARFALDYAGDPGFQPHPDALPPLYHAMQFDKMNNTTVRTAFLLERGASLDAMVTLPDGGGRASLVVFACACDEELGKPLFAGLIRMHTDRRIVEEYEAALAERRARDNTMATLSARAHVARDRFKL